jgi:hypothetical protein
LRQPRLHVCDERREDLVNRSRFAVNGDEIAANVADSWQTRASSR